MFSDVAWAMAGSPAAGQGAAGGGQDFYSMFILIGSLVLIMYFFMIRPQSKRAKEHQKFLDGLKKGDRIITSSGIHGKVFNIQDNIVNVEVADKVRIKINKNAIASYTADQGEKSEDSSAE